MSRPDFSCFPAVRTRLEMVQEQMHIALKVLRDHGCDESADDLSRHLRGLHFYTKPGGMLDVIQNAPPWPEGL